MISKFSVKKPYTVLVAVIMVIILGVVSLTKMTTDLLPNISLPYVIVMTTYPGASPETVEMVVTKPVEASMATISNVESISSTSNENYSMVIMEFAQSANMDSASLEIRESLDQIKSYWDDSIGNPIIMKLNPDMLPIMVAAVGVEGMDTAEISDYTTNYLVPELESIEGVASASASGLLQESVHVIIREDKIAAINEKIFGAIDSEMADAKKELEDGRKELADGKAEIAEGWQEIDKNLADMEEAKQELADGKAEINKQKNDMETGKEELEKQKKATAEKLATAQKELTAIKNQITTGKAAYTSMMVPLQTQLGQMEAKKALVDSGASNTLLSFDTTLDNIKSQVGENVYNNMTIEQLNNQLEAMSQPTISDAMLEQMGVSEESKVTELHQKIKDAVALINNDEIVITPEAFEEIEAQLAPLQEQMAELEKNEEKVDAGLAELAKGEIEAATMLGSYDAKLFFGETQLEAAESQIKSGEEQLESGLEQIESAKDQLRDAEEQLKDAEKQINDGFKQLEEARQDAYLSADMEGVLTVDTVKGLLTAQNFSMPGGYVTEDGIDYLVRIGEKPESTEELASMPLINVNMDGVEVITLGDVADVFMTDNSADIYTNVDGSAGVMVSMQKQTGYSTGNVSDKINDKFAEMMEENSNLKLVNLMDQGIYIDMVMDSIFSNIIIGFGLAIIILILFLKDWKPTVIIAVSIPISLVTAIVCMYFSGVTLNVISLSGLALGIGMLVDNSIVVIENIYRLRNLGYSMKEAATEGSKEVAGAIAASTLTTVCVFLPIVFTEGITRQLFVDMGLTIGYSLVASLVIALTVVPAMASKVLTTTKDPTQGGITEKLGSWYSKILDKCLNIKALILIASLVLLVVSALLSISKGTAFMPEMDSNQLSMTVTLPKDTPLEDTAKVTDEIVERLSTIEDVENIGAMLGSGSMSLTGGESEGTNSTVIYVTTKEKKSKTNQELAKDIEAMMADLEDVELSIQTAAMDMTALSGSGISIQVRGRELDTLQEIAKEVAGIVETVEGTAEVSDGMEEATGEVRVLVDRQKAMDYSLTVGQIFNQLYSKLASPTSATTLTTEIKEYDVYVINEKDNSMTREDLKNIMLDTTDKDGKKVRIPLSEVAEFESKESLKAINRSEQTRYISVSAAIADGYNVGLVSTEVENILKDYELPSGYSLHFSGENEMIMEAMEQLMLMLVLAVAFMYLIMVAQFQSLLSPFIIMFTLPLAFTGGFFALYITNSEVSVISVIGFIMLAGIIVNNGIVLVDYINQLRERGMEKREAILEAGRTRLRPVLMTALTTIFGLMAMVFSTGMGADLSKPMALVTIGGLTYGTLLTLLVIPCIYDIFHREKKKIEVDI
ncbi:MAG: efflux RND transporter permease subunit [Lachnospiraceae bacterium]|nr:efflux RND transporter permease subunit [Lachnospiraceae bacterium]MBR3601684.1 efflux RND transporter permease subunit [Lachnospiraceae bacterium]